MSLLTGFSLEREQKALAIGNDKKLLLKRLNEAKACLNNEGKKLFQSCTYDFENKRLVGNGAVLQWRVRRYPDQPESYENQQTSVGVVFIL